VFAVPNRAVRAVRLLAESGFVIHQLHECQPVQPGDLPPHDIAIFDNYSWDAIVERRWRDGHRTLVAIDDLADRKHACDILVDQTPLRHADLYGALVPAECTVLTGASYALLRPEFAAYREAALARRRSNRSDRLLVSLGLSDLQAIALRVVSLALETRADLSIDVVVSGGAPSLPGLHELQRRGAPLHVHVDTPDIARLMTQADLSVGAGGSTSLERCCLGLPTLIITLADNQREIASALDRLGAARYLGAAITLPDVEIKAALADFLDDCEGRRACAAKASQLVDGRGADRVSSVLAVVAGRRRDG
jgi:UDP-2,4-diacetamido-2,4,6-trideoxy-beta-L-altropyranose hydrolase